MALQAVLFDMDGVIVDTEPLYKEAFLALFKKIGIAVSNNVYNKFIGKSSIDICAHLVAEFNLEYTAEQLVNIMYAYFKELFYKENSNLQLLDGVLELIQNYHKNGLTLVLASSASMFAINSIFERFDLNKYFKGKISGASLKASKPHPEIFIKAAQIAGFSPKECMVIEDSTNGIKAASDAGIYCIAYKSENSKQQDYTLAQQVITNYEAIYFENVKNIV